LRPATEEGETMGDELVFHFEAVYASPDAVRESRMGEPLTLDAALELMCSDEERYDWQRRLVAMDPGEKLYGMAADGSEHTIERVV
jgi:hypothetical protein